MKPTLSVRCLCMSRVSGNKAPGCVSGKQVFGRALVSGKKALQDAGLDPEQDTIKDLDKARCGILIGSAMGGMTSFSNAVEALFTAGPTV
eukprot:1157375-Pelagomonas_calceolata.AAC.11